MGANSSAIPSGTSSKLEARYTANETIVAMQLVKLDDETSVSLATPDTLANSQSIGIAMESKTSGNLILVRFFGVVEDGSFSFALNDRIFLDASSQVDDNTSALVVGDFIVELGKSLGAGSIFLSISPPEEIT